MHVQKPYGAARFVYDKQRGDGEPVHHTQRVSRQRRRRDGFRVLMHDRSHRLAKERIRALDFIDTNAPSQIIVIELDTPLPLS